MEEEHQQIHILIYVDFPYILILSFPLFTHSLINFDIPSKCTLMISLNKKTN